LLVWLMLPSMLTINTRDPSLIWFATLAVLVTP